MTPPRLALWLLTRSLDVGDREAVLGDVLEEFQALSAVDRREARRWIWRQTRRSIWPNLVRRTRTRRVPAEPAAGGARAMDGFVTDLRFALRQMRRQPLTAVVGLLSLVAGLGLNLLLFTIANGILFRPLPLHQPNQLALLLLQRESGVNHNFSYPAYAGLRDATQSLDSLVAYSQAEASAASAAGSEPVNGEVVSGNFFSALGVPMRAGRGLTPDDDRPAAMPAAVISERMWRDRFGAAPLSGQTITLSGDAYTIVGITADEFRGMQLGRSAAFWVPLSKSATIVGGDFIARPTVSWLTLIGRVRAGQRTEAARGELDAIVKGILRAQGRASESMILAPGLRGDSALAEQLGSPLLLLMTAGALVLIVSCINVANLQLVRIESRRLELAVRAALGARRTQLWRLLILDGGLLAIGATAAALALAAIAKEQAVSLIALYGQPVTLATPIDLRVGLFAGLLALASIAVITTLSSWQALRRQPSLGLGDGRTMTTSRRALHRGLVVVQFAVSMALVTGALLLVRTLDRLRGSDLGFETGRVALVEVSPEMGRLSSDRSLAYFDEAIRKTASVPGVESVAVGHVMPFDFGGSRTSIDVARYRPGADEDMELNFLRVTSAYFDTLRIPLRQGRFFDDRDRGGQPLRIIVNDTMARRYWSGKSPIGQFVRFDNRQPFNIEVVGVVPDVHYRMVREEPQPSFYIPLAQMPAASGVLHVRFGSDPSGRLEELRRVIALIDPAVPVMRIGTLANQIERNISEERMAGVIGVTLASVALVLATAGLYATMAFVVGRRTREIGVRVALGARGADVRRLVLGEGLALVAGGVLAGLAFAIWIGHALRNQLYGVSATDLVSLGGAAAVLAVAAVIAGWLPARRAAAVDPVVALRES
jgi:putative ABC transport system permease protein